MDDDKEKIAARVLFSAAIWLLVLCLAYIFCHAMLSMLRHYNMLGRHPIRKPISPGAILSVPKR